MFQSSTKLKFETKNLRLGTSWRLNIFSPSSVQTSKREEEIFSWKYLIQSYSKLFICKALRLRYNFWAFNLFSRGCHRWALKFTWRKKLYDCESFPYNTWKKPVALARFSTQRRSTSSKLTLALQLPKTVIKISSEKKIYEKNKMKYEEMHNLHECNLIPRVCVAKNTHKRQQHTENFF